VALLEVSGLSTAFHTRHGVVRAVNDVSFHLERGETLGIVGESGSGKSVACLSLLGLIPRPPGRIEAGSARFDGVDLLHGAEPVLRAIRGRRIGMIFQDPMTSLNPYLTVEEQLVEPLLIHGLADRAEARRLALAALKEVGVPDAERRIRNHPHQFSGGMRQRVMIAMALIAKPDLLIADEPTTALDVTVQAQILDLIEREQTQRGVAVILISHDLGVVAETAPADTLFRAPQHPYTRALQLSRPALQATGAELYAIPGLPPDPAQPLAGCPFTPRCEFAIDECATAKIELSRVNGGSSACLRVQRHEIRMG
jgi:oligopeptide transport system ATP-binding protein